MTNPPPRTVEVGPFRERFEQLRRREKLTLSAVAVRLDWWIAPSQTHPEPRPDASRVARVLGYQRHYSRDRAYYRQRIRRSTAERLAGALGLDPYEIGL